jgi:hypothetical protein
LFPKRIDCAIVNLAHRARDFHWSEFPSSRGVKYP